MTRLFAGNDNVAFGDVNLQTTPIRGPPHNPGQGGWPTIRYFNSDTGKEGGSYEKRTEATMCTELGNRNYMIDYIETYGNTVLCGIDGTNCNEKELEYLEKHKSTYPGELQTQLDRLVSITSDRREPLKKDLQDWAWRRMRILQRLLAEAGGDGERLRLHGAQRERHRCGREAAGKARSVPHAPLLLRSSEQTAPRTQCVGALA